MKFNSYIFKKKKKRRYMRNLFREKLCLLKCEIEYLNFRYLCLKCQNLLL